MPGVGQYHPQPVLPNPKTGRDVFASKTGRGIIDKQTEKAEKYK